MSFHTKSAIRLPSSQKVFSSGCLLDPDPPFWNKTSWIQLGYGFWVNLTLMNIGLCLEFTAVTIPQLKEEDSSITMTKREEATIASILTLSSPIGCIIAGIILDKCGRKAGLIWCQLPIAIGWFYTAYAKYASGIIFGRVISGIGIGMAMAAPRAYSAEITLPNMRGVIGALPNLTISLGLTIQAVLGSFLGWRILCFICGGYATILLCANCFLPDTPYYVLLNSTASAAKVTLMRFRSSKFNLEAEIQTLEEFKAANNIRRLTFCETRKALSKSSACKPFGIILFYTTLNQCAGVNVMTTWAVEMLQLAHSSVDAHLGNVILAATRMMVGVATSFLLFRLGRRPLALSSAIGVGGVGLFLGGYLHTTEGGRSPLILMILYVMFAVPGYHTLPTLMMFEMFPLQIRGILSGVVLSAANLMMFTSILLYPTMRDGMGLANTFITYGTISLLGAIVLYIILPETKELTLQEIEEYFNHRRETLVSERRLMSAHARSQMFATRSTTGIQTEQFRKQESKTKKRLRIVSSGETMPFKERSSSSIELERKASTMYFDDIVTVYDEDESSLNSDKKFKVDFSKEDNEDDQKDDQQQKEEGKKDETEQVKTENENVIDEVKDKENKTEHDETKEDSEKDKRDEIGPDGTNKPGTSRT